AHAPAVSKSSAAFGAPTAVNKSRFGPRHSFSCRRTRFTRFRSRRARSYSVCRLSGCGFSIYISSPRGCDDSFGSARPAADRRIAVEYDHTLSHTIGMPPVERVTITLPADLLEEVDQLERNRSRFIAEAVQHEVARRRRAALMQSVESPHPDTTQLVDAGLADWTSELPDDEALLVPSGGTAVRWV